MEEIRHHTQRTIEALLSRARRELKREFYEMLEKIYKAELSSGHALDTVYTKLNRALLFLSYVQKLGKSLDEVALDDINTFLADKLNPSTRHAYVIAIRLLGKVNATKYPKFYEASRQVKYPKRKVRLPELPSYRNVKLVN